LGFVDLFVVVVVVLRLGFGFFGFGWGFCGWECGGVGCCGWSGAFDDCFVDEACVVV
jgi:hypothetical protein